MEKNANYSENQEALNELLEARLFLGKIFLKNLPLEDHEQSMKTIFLI